MTLEQSNAMWAIITVAGILMFLLIAVVVGNLRKRRLPEVPPETSGPQVGRDVAVRKEVLDEEDMMLPSTSLKQALIHTERNLFGRIKGLFSSEVENKNFEEIEEVLYTSDLGPQTVERLMGAVKTELGRNGRSKIAWNMLNNAVQAPIARASVINETSERAGVLRSTRNPKTASLYIVSSEKP